MEDIRGISLNKDGRMMTTLQIIIAAMTFLLMSMIGQALIRRAIYSLTESGVLPATVMQNFQMQRRLQ